MSDIIRKIQVQIDYHEAELHRLRSALDVFAEFDGKPMPKAEPMFTVQKIGGGAVTPAAATQERKPRVAVDGGASLADQIKAILSHGKPMKKADIEAQMNFGNRAKKNASNPIANLKAKGEIAAVSGGRYVLTGTSNTKTSKGKEKLPEGGISLRKQVMATLEAFPNQALTRAEMLALINMGDRAPSTFDSMLTYMKKTGIAEQDENGGWRLVKPETPSTVEVKADDASAAA
jgi:hypothetical protein